MSSATTVKKMVIAAAVVGALATATTGVAGATTPGAPSKASGGTHRTPVEKAQAYLSCPLAQARSNRLQRVKTRFNEALTRMNAAEAKAVADHDASLAAFWQQAVTRERHAKAYLVGATRRGYHKRTKYEEYILRLHRKGKAPHAEFKVTRCHLTKLAVPRVTTPAAVAPAQAPAAVEPTPAATPVTTTTAPKGSVATTTPTTSTIAIGSTTGPSSTTGP